MSCLRLVLAILVVMPSAAMVAIPRASGQVKKSRGLGVTSPDAFRLADGFAIDLLHEVVSESEGSWVSLTVDPQGRLIACDQYGGLFRIDVASEPVQVEKLAIDLKGAQGLLCAFDALYANVNVGGPSGGLWRLTDTNGDDQYDKKEHLVPLNAGSEHGPHAVILSPDGKRIVFCAGNNTNLPANISRSRVPQVWSEDHLLGRMPDARGHNADRLAPGGFVASLNPAGSDIEVMAVGFRNHYDIAFNRQGELFTYDADMEWDVGVPWYRPTRVNHVVSGVDFGWRNGTGKWPAYYADSFGSVVDIGPGSPTGIGFGYGAKFPAKYQKALFICDWSYGNIFAVHLEPSGSSYVGTYETFATAAPLPATDLVIRPQDGAMYFTVGGRKTQSGLYRIRYVGDDSTEPVPNESAGGGDAIQHAESLRTIRHQLEALHVQPSADALPLVLSHLGHEDRAIRSAARVALEHLPVESWLSQLKSVSAPHAIINATIALARTGQPDHRDRGLSLLGGIDWQGLSETQRLDMLRAYSLVFLRLGEPSSEQKQTILAQLDTSFPGASEPVNRELSQVLIYLEAPQIVDRAVAMMKDAPSQEDQIHYAFALRSVRQGWTESLRRLYFSRFIDMGAARGGMSFGGFLENIRKAAIEHLPDDPDLKNRLVDVLNPPTKEAIDSTMPPRDLVKVWTVDDLAESVSRLDHVYDYEQGKNLFAAGQCYKCHRVGLQGGILGPDLTAAGRRFTPRDLLVSTIEPSKEISDQYGATQFLTDDGQVVVGRVINMNANNLSVLTNMLDPSSLTNLNRDQIEEARPAKTSMMPTGLLDTFTEAEIVQLMGYLRAGGQKNHPLYQATKASQ